MQNVWVKNVFAKSLCISAAVVLYAETFSIEDWKFQNKVNEKLMPTNTLDYNINGNSLKIAKFNSKFYFVFYKWLRKSQYFNYYKVMHKRIFIFYVFFFKKGFVFLLPKEQIKDNKKCNDNWFNANKSINHYLSELEMFFVSQPKIGNVLVAFLLFF